MEPTIRNSPLFPPTLSVAEAARILGVTPATAYQWVRAGELPHCRLGGRIRVLTSPLARLLGIGPELMVAHGRPEPVRVPTVSDCSSE